MEPISAGSDSEAEEAAMAAMMGFTSFGTQAHARPSKKRRYNPRADAVSAGDGEDRGEDDDEDDDGGASEWGTGANNLPLMPRTARGDGGEAAEGEAGEGEVEEGGGEGALLGAADGDGGKGEAGPQYINRSRSPLRTGGNVEGVESTPVTGGRAYIEPRAAGRDSRGGGGGAAGKRIWWTDYYDPSSNENPWEALEKARGLEASGSWLPKRHWAGKIGARAG